MSLIRRCCLPSRSVLDFISRSNKRSFIALTSRLHTGEISKTTAEKSKAQLRKFRSEEKHFKRRLLSVYQRFADVPENTTLQGQNHIYFEDGKSIYRAALAHDEQEVAEVFSACLGGEGYEIIQRVRLSPSEDKLAATVKNDHHEDTRFVLVHLGENSHPHKALVVLDNVLSFEWATDDVLFYSTQETLRSLCVFRLHLTKNGFRTNLVFEEKDPEFFVEVSRSRDQRLVTVNCNSKNSSEVWFVDSRSPFSRPTLIQSRQPGLMYHVEHSDNHLFILANTGKGQEYQLLRAPLAFPSMPHWVQTFSPVPGTVIKDMELLQDHCVFTVKDSQCGLQIQILTSKEPRELKTVQLPRWACDLSPERVESGNGRSFGFLLSSPVHPPVRHLCSLKTGRLSVTEEDTQHNTIPECNTTRLQAASQDGTMVPLTLFHKSALAHLHKSPLLLHVYGAYGIDLSMTFSPEKRLLLEDGWALAYCHVRGGGERGLSWHRSGCLLQKQKGVEDLVSCIHTLHHLSVSQPMLTALTARSAGAVLAGALCNKNPQLLRAVILQAPFLDVLGTMQDPSLPLTIEERGEWGDPLLSAEHWDNIASYCPCHNVKLQLYPSMLITAYSEDRRVPLFGVVNYVEKLKEAIQRYTAGAGANTRVPAVILDIRPGADHFGPEDFHLSLNENARQFAFLYRELGLDHRNIQKRNKQTHEP